MDLLNSLAQPGSPDFTASIFILVLSIWTVFWKGLALWNAALHKQKSWFIALIIINTLGILEIIYLFRFCKKKYTTKEVIELVKNPKLLNSKSNKSTGQ